MLPSRFGPNAPVIMALRDETASLKAEVSEHRTATQHDARLMEHVVTIKQDDDDIKKFNHEIRNQKGINLTHLLRSCLELYRTVQISPGTFQRGLSRVDNSPMEACDITRVRVEYPVPASTNLLNSETRSARHVSSYSRLVLLHRPYLLTLPHLPGVLGTAVYVLVTELMFLNLLLGCLDGRNFLANCASSIQEKEEQ